MGSCNRTDSSFAKGESSRGRQVADGKNNSKDVAIDIAFLMANQGLAGPGKLVYDPFVGTGSIMVAAAQFGAITMSRANDFINRFKKQLKIQRLNSILNYKEMLYYG